jgi:hypothetical protein
MSFPSDDEVREKFPLLRYNIVKAIESQPTSWLKKKLSKTQA